MKNSTYNEIDIGKKIFYEFLETNKIDNNVKDKFEKLTDLYFQINSIINISSLRTEYDVYIKHYLDSIYPYKHFFGDCCDVGCGGGFPCLPLSLVTGLKFFGIDSVGKKLTLINRCISELDLNNITPIHARSEDVFKRGDRFDTVCARAVANTDTVLSYCAPLANQNGKIILYKTQNDDRASKETESKLKITLSDIEDYVLPETDIKRRLLIYRKL